MDLKLPFIFGMMVLVLSSASFAGDSPRAVQVVRITAPPILDGFLNDDVWKSAEPATDFIQRDPDEGTPASEQTEVRILYDDEAMYFGAMMFDSEPDQIVARLSRRDNVIETDRVAIFIDSFHDHQNGHEFTFNAAGGKVDILLYDDANKEDKSWDAVWDVRTQILTNGWSAEVRIPFSMLRYRSNISDSTEQKWGINFRRRISRKSEQDRWVQVPKSQTGFISHFGHLVGLKNLPSSHRIELLPFVLSKQQWQPAKSDQQRIGKFSGNAGLDFKYSLFNNILLDVTVNPDFGQVEADPAVLNLSTFETFYPEKRPFFIEGTHITRFTTFGDEFGPGMFYSRRIGRALSTSEVSVATKGKIIDMPQATTILGATKISGKTNNGTSIGVLQAFTKEMRAIVADSAGTTSEQVVEPFAHYNILRVRQDVLDNSIVGLILTSTAKEKRYPALTAGGDWNLKLDANKYQLDGFLGVSYAKNVVRERSLGSAGKVSFSRIADEHWLWSVSSDFTSKEYNINDVGFFRRPNDFGFVGSLTYKEDKPVDFARNYSVQLFLHERENFDKANIVRQAQLSGSVLSTNYWTFNAAVSVDVGHYDDRETRGNGLYTRPGVYNANISMLTDGRKDVNGSLSIRSVWDNNQRFGWGLTGGLEVKPASWMEYQLEVGYNGVRNQRAWIENETLGGSTASIFGNRSTHDVNFTLRSTITFTPDLTLQFYGQVFLAKGHYENFLRLAGPTDFVPHNYANNPDFNSQALNTNLVLRWEYLPGSTLFLVWSQARRGSSSDYFRSFVDDFGDTFRAPPANVLLFKVSYWWSL